MIVFCTRCGIDPGRLLFSVDSGLPFLSNNIHSFPSHPSAYTLNSSSPLDVSIVTAFIKSISKSDIVNKAYQEFLYGFKICIGLLSLRDVYYSRVGHVFVAIMEAFIA